jgi:hypothetical protein
MPAFTSNSTAPGNVRLSVEKYFVFPFSSMLSNTPVCMVSKLFRLQSNSKVIWYTLPFSVRGVALIVSRLMLMYVLYVFDVACGASSLAAVLLEFVARAADYGSGWVFRELPDPINYMESIKE